MFDDTNDLNCIEADCWQLLTRAVTDRECGWRLPVLATADGTGLRQRIVVLRAVDAARRTVWAHTDVRSAKVKAIQDAPHVSLLFYDTTRQIQLQLSGMATVETDTVDCDQIWNTETAASLRGYLAPFAPGTIREESATNLPDEFRDRMPTREELTDGRKNFAVIKTVTQSMECVILSRHGNRRAVFQYHDKNLISADWLAP